MIEELIEKEGSSLYVYGKLQVPKEVKWETLADAVTKIVLKGNVLLGKDQENRFKELNVDYEQLEFRWEGRKIENKLSVKVDKVLLESSPDKVLVRNAATIKIAQDVTPALILDYLRIENCAKVSCSEEQESAVAAIAQNVAKIGESGQEVSEMLV